MEAVVEGRVCVLAWLLTESAKEAAAVVEVCLMRSFVLMKVRWRVVLMEIRGGDGMCIGWLGELLEGAS